MQSAPPKTLGGYRTQNFTPPVTGGAPNNFPMHLNRRAGNIPLFIRCGAYRALLEQCKNKGLLSASYMYSTEKRGWQNFEYESSIPP